MKFRRRSFDQARIAPVKVGDEYDVEITEVGSKGDGITRIKNFVVFVSGAKKGDKTHIKITQVRRKFAIAEKTNQKTEEVKEESKEDIEEPKD